MPSDPEETTAMTSAVSTPPRLGPAYTRNVAQAGATLISHAPQVSVFALV